jgi:hypothetical protein
VATAIAHLAALENERPELGRLEVIDGDRERLLAG